MPVRRLIPALLASVVLFEGCGASGGGRLRPADFNGNETGTIPAVSGSAAPKPAGASTAVLPPPSPAKRGSEENPAGAEDTEGEEEPAAPPRASTAPRRPAGEPGEANAGGGGEEPRSPDGSGERFIVDAMVGQVNGKPIYAGEVFQAIGHEQLERLGQSQPRLAFRREAMELIITDLRSRVTNALLLREAERDLTDEERSGMRHYLRLEREDILSNYGGVLALAEEGLEREKGRSLGEELEARRQALLVEKYRNEKMLPKINVHRSDVERYYEDHFDEFSSPAAVTVRIIVVGDGAEADAVDGALASGEPFGEVAARHSDFQADRGGRMPTIRLSGPLDGFNALRWSELNEAVRGLEEGEHTGRVPIDIGYGWVMLEAMEGGESRSLQEVFLEIENQLKGRQFNALSRRYIEDLMTGGSFTPINEMANGLLEVAMTRYARPR